MKSAATYALLVLAILLSITTSASESRSCPFTVGSDKVFAEPWPQSLSWFGTDALAVILPKEGVWPTTVEGNSIALKLLWWSSGYEPGGESNLKVRIRNVSGGKNDAEVSEPTNAGGDSLGAWTMLVGIDFPSPGCWEVTGDYLGQSLTFIVETVEHDQIRRNAT